jgi:hypothetical protein
MGAILVGLGAVIGIVTGVEQIAAASSEAQQVITAADDYEALGVALAAVGGLIVAVALVQLLLAFWVYRGSNRARVFVMLFASLTVLTLIVGAELGDTGSVTDNLPGVALNVLALLTLSSERAMIYARRKVAKRKLRTAVA